MKLTREPPGLLGQRFSYSDWEGGKKEEPGNLFPAPLFHIKNLFLEWKRGDWGQQVQSRCGLESGEARDVNPRSLHLKKKIKLVGFD